MSKRLPFKFHVRYCAGARNEWGWVADGRTEYADTELLARMATLKIQRGRKEILGDMPAKTRQVVRVEATLKKPTTTADALDRSERLADMIAAVSAAKRPHVIESVVAELAEGNKCFVLAYRRASAESLAQDIQKALTARDNATRMRQVDAKLWFAHGEQDPKIRFEYARAYREHEGAAVFVSTIDAMQVAMSLKGCTSVHFADWHYAPAAMMQAEDRGFEPGSTGMAITYYVVKGSIDEHLEALVLPKIETLAKIAGEASAHEMLDLLAAKTDPVDEIWARLTSLAAVEEDD